MTKLDLRVREWAALKFHDPEHVLRELRRIETEIASLPPETKRLSARALRLRTNALKPHREGRDAALFSHGMSAVLGTKVLFAPVEKSDYDFVAAYGIEDTLQYTPVQLKEYAPADLATKTDLQNVLGGLSKYAQSDTVVAVRLNRHETLDLRQLQVTELPFSQLWFFWCASEDQSVWNLYGNVLGDPHIFEFRYPG